MKAQNMIYLYVVLRYPKRLQFRELKCLHENRVEVYLLRPFTLTPCLKHIHFFFLSASILTLVQEAIRSADWFSNQDFSPGLLSGYFFLQHCFLQIIFLFTAIPGLAGVDKSREPPGDRRTILLGIVGRPQTLGSDCYLNSESVICINHN